MTQHKKQRLYTLLMIVQGLTIFVGVLLVVMVYANWPALQAEWRYAVKPKPDSSVGPTLKPVANVTATPQPIKQIIESPHIVVEKIGLDAPITWGVPAEATINYLNKGVAHLAGSATLGQIGNVFITGHSSDYVWKGNPYAAVFALIPKLTVGDTITIKENGKSFVYQVAQTKIVAPDNVEVTKPTTTPVLTLMTCYPVGTTKERYIVQANLISSPDQLTASTQTNQTLPEIKFR